jgi:hypothetical protein
MWHALHSAMQHLRPGHAQASAQLALVTAAMMSSSTQLQRSRQS